MKKAFCLTMVLTMLMMLSACGSSIQDEWASILVGKNVPTPQKGKLKSGSNLDDYFSGSIDNVSEEYYSDYVDACIDMGYTIDSKKSGSRYEAFNKEGYKISLSHISGDMHIIIQSPEELSEITWPTTGIGAKLPVPVSNLGKVTSDSSKCFRITVGNTTINDYNNYVKACEQEGFIVDYIKNEGSYEAKNAEGFRLNLSYTGCNRIDVMIQVPKEENNTTSSESTAADEEISKNEQISTSEEASTNGLSKDFKDAMDSYEEFFDEYVAFMKKYKNFDGTDISILLEYSNYLTKYADMMKKFEEWEGKDLSTAEAAYYVEVQNRIIQKLLEVAE